MHNKAERIRKYARVHCILWLALLSSLMCFLQSSLTSSMDYDWGFLTKAFCAGAALIVILALALIITFKANRASLENREERFRRQFLKHPYLAPLPHVVLPFCLGLAISHTLGGQMRPWTVIDYGTAALIALLYFGIVTACKRRMQNHVCAEVRTCELIREQHKDFGNGDQWLLGFLNQVQSIHMFYSMLVRNNPRSPRFMVELLEKMDRDMNSKTKLLAERSSNNTSNTEVNRLLNVAAASFPYSLFAKDILGETVSINAADGRKVQILDEYFPIPAKRKVKLRMKKDSTAGCIQLFMGASIVADYVISNIPISRTEEKLVEVTFKIDSNKVVTLEVKKPLQITKK